MDRRAFLASVPAVGLWAVKATPEASEERAIVDPRSVSLQYATATFDVRTNEDGDELSVISWSCGFIAHPSSRGTYRGFLHRLDGQDSVVMEIPGMPAVNATFVERAMDVIGEEAIVASTTSPDDAEAHGAFITCLNGSFVQFLMLVPSSAFTAAEAVESLSTIARATQERDPAFYGRGELNRKLVEEHLVEPNDLKTVFHSARLREYSYVFSQDDGVSDFWE